MSERGDHWADPIVFGALRTAVRGDGVALVTFSRPLVNAVSLSVYEDIGRLAGYVQASDTIRVLVITAPEGAKAWCGGADLHEFKGMTAERRRERYRFINEQLPRFHRIERPMIAAINAAAIGVGVMLAGMCDMRIASEHSRFACPEVDYGLVGGSAGLFSMLKMPEAKSCEMLYTGRGFSVRELEPTGFVNYVVPPAAVLPLALDLAGTIARKSMNTLRARKRQSLSLEGPEWMQAYLEAQEASSALVEEPASRAGVEAALASINQGPSQHRNSKDPFPAAHRRLRPSRNRPLVQLSPGGVSERPRSRLIVRTWGNADACVIQRPHDSNPPLGLCRHSRVHDRVLRSGWCGSRQPRGAVLRPALPGLARRLATARLRSWRAIQLDRASKRRSVLEQDEDRPSDVYSIPAASSRLEAVSIYHSRCRRRIFSDKVATGEAGDRLAHEVRLCASLHRILCKGVEKRPEASNARLISPCVVAP